MLIRSLLCINLLCLGLFINGCSGTKVIEQPANYSYENPIYKESEDIAITLLGVADKGERGTLVKDSGWREYFLEIQNRGKVSFTIENVKMLNQQGRYVDSASLYEQIIVPPDSGVELAGDVAGTAAGIALGQVIPFGGSIVGIFSGAASASSEEAKINAQRTFLSRLLKNVELAPGGSVMGSAYLPVLKNPQVLVVDYMSLKNDQSARIEIPLAIAEK